MVGRGENNTLPNRTRREQYPSYFYMASSQRSFPIYDRTRREEYPSYFYMASYQRSFPIYGRTRREQYPSYFLDGVVATVVSHIW